MRALLEVELRRYLARRLTRVLVGVAVVGSAVAGVVVFINTEEYSPARAAEEREARIAACVGSFRSVPAGVEGLPVPTRRPAGGAPAFGPDPTQVQQICRSSVGAAEEGPSLRLTELWAPEGGDAIWAVTSVFLGIGALIGSASMVGAEWKAGTFTTLLTWEPRRVRVAITKLAAAGLLAVVVAVALQLVLTGALLPTILLRGTTEGADGEWVRAAAGGLARSGLLAGLAAVVGGAVAMIGRSTSAALGAAFAYLAIVEAILRAWKPLQARWLLGENATIFLTGRRLDNAPFERPVALAWATLLGYTVALVVLAAVTFRNRDVAG